MSVLFIPESERNADYMRHKLWLPEFKSPPNNTTEQPSTGEQGLSKQVPSSANQQQEQDTPSTCHLYVTHSKNESQSIFPTNHTVFPQ